MKTSHLPVLLLAGSLSLLTPLLQGCLPVAAVGVTAGVLAASDRRGVTTQAVDEEIELKAEAQLREKLGDKGHISVVSYNRKVLLVGEATTAALKAEASRIVRGVPNVDGITDEVVVGAISSLTARSNDAYITSKVKARFVEAGKFSVNHIKVVSEAGTVFLLGLVTEREAKDAIEIARTTAGVRKVVSVVETISDSQARALDNAPAQSGAAPVDSKAPKAKN